MTHFSESERSGAAWIVTALMAATHAVKAVLPRSAQDPLQRNEGVKSTGQRPGPAHEAFGPEVAAHLRKILESGYIEEESGKQVRIPPFIRAQLASELRLLL